MHQVLFISKLLFLIPVTAVKLVLNAFLNVFTFCNDTLDIFLLSIKPDQQEGVIFARNSPAKESLSECSPAFL